MKLESRRERAERLKKQRRSTLAGMIIAIIVVVALGVVLWRGKAGLEEKNADLNRRCVCRGRSEERRVRERV